MSASPIPKEHVVSTENFVEKQGNILEREKHPLENTWCLWLNTNMSNNFKENQINITAFDTVEDFWCLYHHAKLPSELNSGQDYSMFKKSISPMWEDEANKRGCRLVILFEKRQFAEMDRMWLDAILMCIGENFNNLNHLITGIVVNIKPKNNKNKISVWLADKKNKKDNIFIGNILKSALGISWKLNFHPHDSREIIYTC